MLAGFKVGVGEAEEEVGELGAGEEVGEEFHGVGAVGGDVLVEGGWGWGGSGGGGVEGAEGGDAVVDVGCYLGADFEAWVGISKVRGWGRGLEGGGSRKGEHTEDEVVRKEWGKCNKETAEAAADVRNRDIFHQTPYPQCVPLLACRGDVGRVVG